MIFNFHVNLFIHLQLYGCETWKISKAMKDRVMAANFWQRILKIS